MIGSAGAVATHSPDHPAWQADGLLQSRQHQVFRLLLRPTLEELVLIERKLVLYSEGQSGGSTTPEAAVRLTMK